MVQKILAATMMAALLAWPKPAVIAAQGQNGGRTPVIVELFTSEGCSDCPPAEALATHLARTQSIPGAEVLVLAEHVDYFNSAHWADRFSSSAFTNRQEGYVSRFHLSSAYTPQMVVDGRTEFVGSDAGRADQAITEAAQAPHAEVALSTTGNTLHVQVGHVPTGTGPADVLLAVTEDNLRVHIGGGENAGQTLEHNSVVRSLRIIGSIAAAGNFDSSLTIPQKSPKSQCIVFVQERANRRILGSGGLTL